MRRLVKQLCPAGSSVHEDSSGKNTGVGCHACLLHLPASPALQAESLPTEPLGEPKNVLCLP